jgi:hypothetical protein
MNLVRDRARGQAAPAGPAAGVSDATPPARAAGAEHIN